MIVLIGENRTFDHIFATYLSRSGDSVSNLLSKGIINADGSPGKHFYKAAQFQAVPPFNTKYFISLDKGEKTPYETLPGPTLNLAPNATTFPPGKPASLLAAVEPSLDADDLALLTTGGTGLGQSFIQPDPDTRVQNYNALPLRDHPYVTSQSLTVSKSCWIAQEHVRRQCRDRSHSRWVISRRAPARLQACSSTRRFSFSISVSNFVYTACNSFRRYAVCGASGNDAIVFCPS